MEELPDLHIQRPYASLEEYLEGDFWTVERKDMFLIGAGSFELGVAVKFTIELADGTPVVTGEGRVVEYIAPSDEFPGGLKVRFRQLDSESKAVLRRALEVRRRAYAAAMEAAGGEAGASAGTTGETPAGATGETASAATGETASAATGETASAATGGASGETPAAGAPVERRADGAAIQQSATAAAASEGTGAVTPAEHGVSPAAGEQNVGASAAADPSAVRDSGRGAPAEEKPLGGAVKARERQRAERVVSAPPNRDALLGRLRERAQRIGPALGRAFASGK